MLFAHLSFTWERSRVPVMISSHSNHELRGLLAPLANGIEILKLQGASDPAVTAMMERQIYRLRECLDTLQRGSHNNQRQHQPVHDAAVERPTFR